MQVCFYCSNNIDSSSDVFLRLSCGKCDACLENCPGAIQKRKRGDVRDLPCSTVAESGNGLSTIIAVGDIFTSVAKHLFVDMPGSLQYM